MGRIYWRESSEIKLIVVATDEEYKLARKRYKWHYIIQTGVGGINVVRKLKRLPKWLKIVSDNLNLKQYEMVIE